MSATPVLAADTLTVARGPRTVLHGVGFDIHHGERVAIIGPNGAGKTTLLLTLLGILHPQSGAVRLNGVDLQRIRPRRRIATHMAYVPQHYDGFMGFTVYDMVAAARYAQSSVIGLHSSTDRAVVESALATCEIEDLATRLVSQLSAGQRQMVWIAAAVAQESPFLLLDEPTTALDPRHHTDVLTLLDRLAGDGRTLIFVSHDLNIAVSLDARVLALRDGRLVMDDHVTRVVQPEPLHRIFDTTFDLPERPAGGRWAIPG